MEKFQDNQKIYSTICNLTINLTGTKEAIKNELLKIISEIDSDYGKPIQGKLWKDNLFAEITTSVWNGKKYS